MSVAMCSHLAVMMHSGGTNIAASFICLRQPSTVFIARVHIIVLLIDNFLLKGNSQENYIIGEVHHKIKKMELPKRDVRM